MDDIEVYEIGQLVRLAARFTNAANRVYDPTNVYVEITDPSGAATTLQYGVDLTVIKDSTGQYHIDQSATAVGTWAVRWYSTGSGQAAKRGRFIVEY